MILVTIEFCKWCNSPRPTKCVGAENLPPGTHAVQLQISHGMCDPCGTRFSDGMGSKNVTQSGTVKKDNASNTISG